MHKFDSQQDEPTLVVLHGVSSSGKSSVCDYMRQKYGWTTIHPIEDLKNFLASHYSCPSLDTEEGKAFVPDKARFGTMQNLMVKLYHFFKEEDPYFSSRQLTQLLKSHYHSLPGTNLITGSIRNPAEVEAIANSPYKRKIWINLSRANPNRSEETSDENYWFILGLANASQAFVHGQIVNDFSTVEEWQEACSDLIAELTVKYYH